MTTLSSKKDIDYTVTDQFNKSNPFLFKYYGSTHHNFVLELVRDNNLEEHQLNLAYQIMLSGVIFSIASKVKLSENESVAQYYKDGYSEYLVDIFKNNDSLVDFVIDNSPDMFSALNGPAKIMTVVYKSIVGDDSEKVNLFELISELHIYNNLSYLIKEEGALQAEIIQKLKKYKFQDKNNDSSQVELHKILETLKVAALMLDDNCQNGEIDMKGVELVQTMVNSAREDLSDLGYSGDKLYLVYEVQSLIYWINNEVKESVNLVESAVTVKGDKKLLTITAREILKKKRRLQSNSYLKKR